MLQFFLSQQLYLDLQLPQSGDELSLSLDAPALYHKHKQELSAPWATASAHCSFRLMSLHPHLPSQPRTLSDDDNQWRQNPECPDLEKEARMAFSLWMCSPQVPLIQTRAAEA